MTRIKVQKMVENSCPSEIIESDVDNLKTTECIDSLMIPILNECMESDIPENVSEEEEEPVNEIAISNQQENEILGFHQIMQETLQEKLPNCECESLVCYTFKKWAELNHDQRSKVCKLAIYPDSGKYTSTEYDLVQSNQAIQCLVNELLENKEPLPHIDETDEEFHSLVKNLLDLEEELQLTVNTGQKGNSNAKEEETKTDMKVQVPDRSLTINQELELASDLQLCANKDLEEDLMHESHGNFLVSFQGNVWNVFPRDDKGASNTLYLQIRDMDNVTDERLEDSNVLNSGADVSPEALCPPNILHQVGINCTNWEEDDIRDYTILQCLNPHDE